MDICQWITILKEWQTLLASLIALGAAFWTIREIRKQVAIQRNALESQQKQFDEIRRRREIRAQAELPDALADINRYSGDTTGSTKDSTINEVKSGLEVC